MGNAFWPLVSSTAASIQAIFPHVPSSVRSLPDLHLALRRGLVRRLHADGAPDPRPFTLNPREMCEAYPFRAGPCPVRSSMKPHAWLRLHRTHCASCSSSCYIHTLLRVLTNGWSMAMLRQPAHFQPRPRRFTEEEQHALDKDLIKAVAEGTVVPLRHFPRLAAPRFVVLKSKFLASITEMDTPGFDASDQRWWKRKARPITNYSAGHSKASSVNGCAHPFRLRYPPLGDLLSRIKHGWWVATCDIASCYTSIPLAAKPDPTRSLLAFVQRCPVTKKWRAFEPAYVTFGGTSFPGVACTLTGEAAAGIRVRYPCTTVYVDDVATGGPTERAANAALRFAVSTLRSLGWTIQEAKTQRAAQRFNWLGFVVDTVAGTVSVDQLRIAHMRAEVDAVLHHRHGCATSRLRSLVGRLTWASQVMYGAKTFLVCLHRIANISKRFVKLPPMAIADLEWFRHHLASWNGARTWLNGPVSFSAAMSDASGTVGYGCHTADYFIHGTWDDDLQPRTVDFKELYAVFRMLQAYTRERQGDNARGWPPETWHDRMVIVATDSALNTFRLNSGRATGGGTHIITLLRDIATLSHRHRIALVATHVRREINDFADALSKCTSYRQACEVFRQRTGSE